MGVDLKIVVPDRTFGTDGPVWPQAILGVDRWSVLFEPLENFMIEIGERLSQELRWYEDDGVTSIRKDPYGSDLRIVSAADFAEVYRALIEQHSEPIPRMGHLAALAYVEALEPDDRVITYWS